MLLLLLVATAIAFVSFLAYCCSWLDSVLGYHKLLFFVDLSFALLAAFHLCHFFMGVRNLVCCNVAGQTLKQKYKATTTNIIIFMFLS